MTQNPFARTVRTLAAAARAFLRVVLLDLVNSARSLNATGDRVDRVSSQTQTLLQNPLFDAVFYKARYRLDLNDADLYLHYCHTGRFKNFDPNAYFSTSSYLEQNADVRKIGINPLDHYLECGAVEGRDPGPAFSSWIYWLLNPDVKASGMNPLLHYLLHGRHEGRVAPALQSLSYAGETSSTPLLAPVGAARLADAEQPVTARRAEQALRASPDDPLAPAWDRPVVRRSGPGGPIRARSRADDLPATRVIARRCPTRVRWFAKLFARDLASSFDSVRLLGCFPTQTEGPLVLLTNHPSWWDAELYHWLAVSGFKDRRGFAPMEAKNLARYPILTRLGAFPTCPGGGFAGASAFMNTAERLLQQRDAVLFIAAEGRFRDQRERPIRVLPGVAHLARRVPNATFIPLAIDYVFWKDRRPNLLLHFGQPISPAALADASTGDIARCLSIGLETTMSLLAEAGMSRQPLRFTTLLEKGDASRSLRGRWVGATPSKTRPRQDLRSPT